MSDIKVGSRVYVDHLINVECSDTDVLIGHAGTVVDGPYVDNGLAEMYSEADGWTAPNPVVQVLFDEPAIEPVTGQPESTFVFSLKELESLEGLDPCGVCGLYGHDTQEHVEDEI